MLQNDGATIVAQATPPGYGGIGVVRVSGQHSATIAAQILGKTPRHRIATYSDFLDSQAQVLDRGLALFFKAPHSFTGEDVLELQGHGGPVVMETLIQTILGMGARLAAPGEFSLRAFLNNKIDLIQAEAVADLIHAHSVQAARGAMRSLQGDFSKAVQNIVEDVIRLRVFVESMIDFPEEAIESLQTERIMDSIRALEQALDSLIHKADQGVLINRAAKVVIMGLPNAGKSSLLNALCAQETAIVTDRPGTTRDLVRSNICVDGMMIELCDTAGLREAEDVVEAEGVRRAMVAATHADHIVWVVDASQEPLEDHQFLLRFHNVCPKEGVGITVLYNKMDMAKLAKQDLEKNTMDNTTSFHISAKTGDGLLAFKNHLKKTLGFDVGSEQNFSARARHVEALKEAKHFMIQAAMQSQASHTLELVAEELRAVQRALEAITGRFSSDDLLSKIFSTFCIGK